MTGKTILYPVIGHPVAQVRAPTVFNALFARAGMDALVIALDLPPHSVVEVSRALLDSRSVGGLLVIAPYKKTLFELLGGAGARAQLVGATNAIRNAEDGTLVGELFDGLGFVRGLQAGGHALAGKKVLLLGAGGAGSAIAAALAVQAIGVLRIFDPHMARGVDLADLLSRRYPGCEFTPVDRLMQRARASIRIELVLRAPELKRLDLQSPHAWSSARARALMQPWLDDLCHAWGVVPQIDGMEQLPRGTQIKLRAHLLGDTTVFAMSPTTYSVNRRAVLAATGVDIANPLT